MDDLLSHTKDIKPDLASEIKRLGMPPPLPKMKLLRAVVSCGDLDLLVGQRGWGVREREGGEGARESIKPNLVLEIGI